MVSFKQNASTNPGGARLVIYPKKTLSPVFFAPYAPKKVTYSGGEGTYNEVPRPARSPLLTRAGYSLRKISMELFIGSELIDEPMDDYLDVLQTLATSELPLIVEYDPRTKGEWNITSLSFDSEEREPSADIITRATAQIELTEVIDPIVVATAYAATTRPKKYRPKQGESLRSICMTFYGTADPLIVKAVKDANDINNVRRLPSSIRLP